MQNIGVSDSAAGFIKRNIINPNTISEFTSWITSRPEGGHAFRIDDSTAGGAGYAWSCGYVTRIGDTWAGFIAHYNYGVRFVHGNDASGNTRVSELWTDKNTHVDGGGFIKKASPVIKIWNDGKFETNDESEGATVERLSEGVYLIKNVLGFNADAAWGGTDGGVEIPICKNKLPLIWVDYTVLDDGAIKLMTYHREHPNAPEFARNKREGYADGDLIDIPNGRFVSVRVQMPATEEEMTTPAAEVLPLIPADSK
ncbi:Similarities with prophage tail fiber protein (fragment) [Xenorhabdus poinarii G6]|uniref:Similarities with prophage tail fiber protein n=1 Tax=Xenorhabdus poinarii G6 TaxID=1354304 RepID=A0A068QY86_9GAMM